MSQDFFYIGLDLLRLSYFREYPLGRGPRSQFNNYTFSKIFSAVIVLGLCLTYLKKFFQLHQWLCFSLMLNLLRFCFRYCVTNILPKCLYNKTICFSINSFNFLVSCAISTLKLGYRYTKSKSLEWQYVIISITKSTYQKYEKKPCSKIDLVQYNFLRRSKTIVKCL